MSCFVLGILNDCFGTLAEIDLVFVIDEFGKGGFHFWEMFDKGLIVGLDFIDEGMVGFDDSGNNSCHEFNDRIELNWGLVVLL